MKNFKIEEKFEIENTTFFIISYDEKYACLFEGREESIAYLSHEGAKIEGLCAYQKLTGKKLVRPA